MTFVRTYNGFDFADPYKTCDQCGAWITGVLDNPGVPILMPCEHKNTYTDQCPSWGPVDGCLCREYLGYVPHGQPPQRSGRAQDAE